MPMLVNYLTKRGTKDLLVPYFGFRQLLTQDEDEALFEQIARLRYEVYCAECRYLDAADFEFGLETDDFDHRAMHVAAQTLDADVVGTVRLVLADSDADAFPFEEHCSVFPDFKLPHKDQSGEISRLIVKKSMRRRTGDSLQGVSKEFQEKGNAGSIAPQAATAGAKRRSQSPQIMLGMYREMYRYSRANGIRYWYAAMEKGLWRLLDRMGFHFEPVGPETDYYGPVTTYMADLRELEVRLRELNPFMLAWFQDERISDWMLVSTVVKYKLFGIGKV